MGLRQRKSLLRCQSTEGDQPKRKSSSQNQKKPRSKKSARNPNIKLVSGDNGLSEKDLEQFLDPNCDFEPALTISPKTLSDAPGVPAPTRVEAAVKTLGKLESEVIAALFPPSGGPPATLDEISQDLGMTVAEVQNIADEALRGLRGLQSGPPRISKVWN